MGATSSSYAQHRRLNEAASKPQDVEQVTHSVLEHPGLLVKHKLLGNSIWHVAGRV